ncbi:MAG: hypothetical protein AB4368_33125 [Xenococcaceae cyanobacterium]
MMKLQFYDRQQPISRAERENSYSILKTIADDELREASIRQRVRKIENNLFDEYWDELGVHKLNLFDAILG